MEVSRPPVLLRRTTVAISCMKKRRKSIKGLARERRAEELLLLHIKGRRWGGVGLCCSNVSWGAIHNIQDLEYVNKEQVLEYYLRPGCLLVFMDVFICSLRHVHDHAYVTATSWPPSCRLVVVVYLFGSLFYWKFLASPRKTGVGVTFKGQWPSNNAPLN